jgi:hypothetical protein
VPKKRSGGKRGRASVSNIGLRAKLLPGTVRIATARMSHARLSEDVWIGSEMATRAVFRSKARWGRNQRSRTSLKWACPAARE